MPLIWLYAIEHLPISTDNTLKIASILQLLHIPTQQQKHTLQPDNHIIPSAPRTEANPLTKGTQPILIQPFRVVLPHAVLAEFTLASVLVI